MLYVVCCGFCYYGFVLCLLVLGCVVFGCVVVRGGALLLVDSDGNVGAGLAIGILCYACLGLRCAF